MATADTATNPVIGLTGAFGSGCSYVAEHILSKMGFRVLSLSNALKTKYEAAKGRLPNGAARRALQDFGDNLRQADGQDCLAKWAVEEAHLSKREREGQIAFRSIKNPAEIRYLRKEYQGRFFLVGINADREERWKRVRAQYDDDKKQFDDDDRNDNGDDNSPHGQRVADCFSEADVVFTNNTHIQAIDNEEFKKLTGRLTQILDLVAHPLQRRRAIREQEALMAMAYAISQRSSCIKRKVGAIIVDGSGNVISSGFNEVPAAERPCEAEYTLCFREKLRTDFVAALTAKRIVAAGMEKALEAEFREQFKILDCCRALHAEENAIVNLARNGRSVPLKECTLYTTTYPCRLCANKIANLNIGRVVYLEPYPDPEAKTILKDQGVVDEFFEGVTFRAYFRIYGEEKR